jgi:anti-sigma factor RsiW
MKQPPGISLEQLHAYADGQLSPQEEPHVEAWLAENPDDAAAVHAYRVQNRRLHETFDPVLEENVPANIVEIVKRQPSVAVSTPGWWLKTAASLLLLLAGAIGGWTLHGWQGVSGQEGSDGFVQRAVGAHRVFVSEVRHPVEVPSSQEAHLVAWLSKRLGTKLRAPDVSQFGFNLVGGRLLADGALPAAQFMYQDSKGERLTVYVRAADGREDMAFRFASTDTVSAFYWIDRNFAFALVAPVGKDSLSQLANKAYYELAHQ